MLSAEQVGLQWSVTLRRTQRSGCWLYLQPLFRLSHSSCFTAARKGRTHPYSPTVVQNSSHLICREEWSTANDFKYLLLKTATSWKWRGSLMELGFTCRNTRVWVDTNLPAIHEESPHPHKEEVCCAVLHNRIIAHTFFGTTINTGVYLSFS